MSSASPFSSSPSPESAPLRSIDAFPIIACPECGLEQRLPRIPVAYEAVCTRCGKLVEQSEAWGLVGGLAVSFTVLILLIAANLSPLMRASIGGPSTGSDIGGMIQGLFQGVGSHQAYIASGVVRMWGQGAPLLALLFGTFTLVLPLVWAVVTTLTLASLSLNLHPRWLGRLFRYNDALRLWAMPDVLVLAGFVVYMRTSTQLNAHIAPGGWCLIAASLVSFLWPALVAHQAIWRRIGPAPGPAPAPGSTPQSPPANVGADQAPSPPEPTFHCDGCELAVPIGMQGHPCPRCRRRLHRRKPNSLNYTAALIVTSYLLCIAAYYFPMSYTVQPDGVHPHTIISAIIRLQTDGYWYLAVIICIVSIAIPFLKLTGLTWLMLQVRWPTRRGLVLRTWAYRIIHRMGRWSNTDPFIIAIMSPLLAFRGLVDVLPGPAALPFALVVTLTMLAARGFDPRLMWDAASGAP